MRPRAPCWPRRACRSTDGHIDPADRLAERRVLILPKLRLDLVVRDEAAEPVARMIAKAVGVGAIGDGKIWVAAVDSVLRIRTGELDDDALWDRKPASARSASLSKSTLRSSCSTPREGSGHLCQGSPLGPVRRPFAVGAGQWSAGTGPLASARAS